MRPTERAFLKHTSTPTLVARTATRSRHARPRSKKPAALLLSDLEHARRLGVLLLDPQRLEPVSADFRLVARNLKVRVARICTADLAAV